MNYYFLLEDEKSLLSVLPEWLEYLNFRSTRVADIKSVKKNHYVLQSGQGVTQLVTKVLYETIETIIDNPNKIDKLVIILDTEGMDAQLRKKSVLDKIAERYDIEKLGFEIKIFVCDCCFESWLLGGNVIGINEVIDSESLFYSYYKHYDVSKNDPELMKLPIDCHDTLAKYHFHYLHEMCLYKKLRYRKNNPKLAKKKEYFDGLMKRIEMTSHLQSFKEFIDFIINE